MIPSIKNGVKVDPKPKKNDAPPRRPFQKLPKKSPPAPKSNPPSIFDLHKQQSPHKQARAKPSKNGKSPPPTHSQNKGEREATPPPQLLCREGEVDINPVDVQMGLSSASELSPAMRELISKMETYIHIESHKGISTIELEIDFKHSDAFFRGTSIRIEHYDTHPHSFNIQLANSTESVVRELTLHLFALEQSLQMQIPHFEVCILPPVHPKLTTSRKSETAKKLNKRKPENLVKSPL